MSSGYDLESLVQRIGTTSDHQSYICVETPHLKALALDWMDAYASIGRIARRCDRQEAQVARLQAALTAALDDLEARDELSALDGLRAALVAGEPSAEPGAEE